MIQAIVCALVFMSGAGMSVWGPTNKLVDAVDEAPRQPLQLALAEFLDVHRDAALGAAVGEAGEGRLPRHERGEGADLVEVDVRGVAQAALVRAASVVVLDAVALEDPDRAVVELQRDLDRDGAVRGDEQVLDVLPHVHHVHRPAEVVVGVLEAHASTVPLAASPSGLYACARCHETKSSIRQPTRSESRARV